jgi:hypothetical protein
MERVYAARAKEWGLGETDTGKEQIAVQFEILTPDADIRRITWFGYFTEKTMERTIQSLRYCGWQGDDLSNLSDLDLNEVELVIDDETYEGKTRTKVKWVNRGGGLALKAPMDAVRKKAFAASMRANIKAIDAGASPNPRPERAAAQQRPRPQTQPQRNGGSLPQPPFSDTPPPIGDDDIPF